MASTQLEKARAQIASARSSAVARVMESRSQIRQVTSAVETVAGAGLCGYIDATMPTGIGGVPAGAGIGLVLVGAGVALKQPDATALGLGMLAGQAYKYGATYGAQNS